MQASRRTFLKAAGGTAALASAPRILSASIAHFGAPETSGSTSQRLSANWELYQGSLAGPWQVWHSSEIAAWSPVTLPHCFNALDGCDPDTPAYRGPGWYRTHLPIDNPLPNGRTLLHFEGAGQTTTLFVADTQVGRHLGGYDEFVFDIT